jgi:hypothetical protein
MTERRHWPAFDQAYVIPPLSPVSESVPWKFRAPSEPTDNRLYQHFDHVSQPGVRTDSAEDNQFAAPSQNTAHSSSAASGFGTVEIT